ncbi:SMP-30/gluconolactonase/LRE family protein [bacterium]|nr:SMP-30/gluconolactonase/LRE family protein [bacterium]
MTHTKLAIGLCALLLATGAATSCQVPLAHQTQAPHAPLTGRILEIDDRSTLAALAEVANGATVSLIDAVSGRTVATTVSAPNGSFSLAPLTAPVENRPYLLEASKGLGMGLGANRIGAPVARLRTLAFYAGGSWTSLSGGSTPQLGPRTTALAIIGGLKGLSPAQLQALSSKLSGGAFDPTGTAIASDEFTQVHALVRQALEQDLDPVGAIAYEPGAPARFALKPGEPSLFESYTPTSLKPGQAVTVYGQNLPLPDASVSVTVGKKPVLWGVSGDRTQLRLQLPSDAHSGYVELKAGTSTWMGPYLFVSGTVGTFAGDGPAGDYDRLTWRDAKGTYAQLNAPNSIVRNPADGNFYFTDRYNGCIRRMTPQGVVSTFTGIGKGYQDGGPGQAKFADPFGLGADPAGNLYVGDTGNNVVRKVDPTGNVTTLAGTKGQIVFQDGQGPSARFKNPVGMAFHGGYLYVADYTDHRIRRIAADGTVVTVAGDGTNVTQDGVGTAAKIAGPIGLTVDNAGNLYATEYNGLTIRKIEAGTFNVTTLAGTALASGSIDGIGAAARFVKPYHIRMNENGNLVVSDPGANRIRQVTPAGVVTTLAGSDRMGALDGGQFAATFRGLTDAMPWNGSLFIADRFSHRIRTFTY